MTTTPKTIHLVNDHRDRKGRKWELRINYGKFVRSHMFSGADAPVAEATAVLTATYGLSVTWAPVGATVNHEATIAA